MSNNVAQTHFLSSSTLCPPIKTSSTPSQHLLIRPRVSQLLYISSPFKTDTLRSSSSSSLSSSKHPFPFRKFRLLFTSKRFMPQLLHDASISPTGPFLLFRGTFKDVQQYSILVVYPPSMKALEPELQLSIGTLVSKVLLDTPFDYHFWCFTFQVPLRNEEQWVKYEIQGLASYQFRVPGINQPWRWSFFSCNGYSSDISEARRKKYNGIQPLWQDILNEHQQKGLHVLIGGGDQLYFDPLFEVVPGLNPWAKMNDKLERKLAPFTEDMEKATSWFYMNHYLHGFMDGLFAQALAQIPYCMAWDDHDIFDGFGSYPDYLQESRVFKGIFKSALRFYLLFQHHTTPALAKEQDGYFGQDGFNKVIQCGQDLVIVLPDTRTERTLNHIITPTSYDAMFKVLENLTPKPKHLLFIAPIPMLYPHSESDKMVRWVGTGFKFTASVVKSVGQLVKRETQARHFIENTKMYKSAVNRFGEPELLDDLLDHWTCVYHATEKKACLLRFQHYAETYLCRITIVSGDVHLAACGRAFRLTPTNQPTPTLCTNDPTGMFQIVSSGIGNLPPPPIVAWNLERDTQEHSLDDHTVEQMVPLFKLGPTGHKNASNRQRFLRRRNWALGELRSGGGMNVWICAEKEKGSMKGETQRYLVDVVNINPTA